MKTRIKTVEAQVRIDSPRRDSIQCSLPPDEALRRAMLVKPPQDWQRTKAQRKSER